MQNGRNRNIFRRGIAAFLTIVIAASLLSGCSRTLSPGDTNSNNGNNTDAQATAAREDLVRTSKISRYFENIKNDPLSLAAFINYMPKGADVRLMPSQFVNPTEVSSDLPFSDVEFENLVARAIMQRINYLEIIANLTPGQIIFFDTIHAHVSFYFRSIGVENKLVINYLAAVSGDCVGLDFEEELEAALDLYELSDRIVGIAILPATTAVGYDAFNSQMRAIDEALIARGFASAAEIAAMQTPSVSVGANGTTQGLEKDPDEAIDESKQAPKFSIAIDASFIATTENYAAALNQITTALDLGHASRIDYGASIVYEIDTYGLLKRLATMPICVTLAPIPDAASSNPLAADASGYEFYSSAGITLSFVSSSSSDEYPDLSAVFAQMVRAHDLKYSDLKALAYNSFDAAFITPEQRDVQRERLDEAFLAFEREMAQTIDDLQLLRTTK
ncbi:MAG: hypothetical protein FWD43_00790 [Coriobacteriia bacterium]|nr:hypothetical protein [Coriobacteriia bacterium]